MKLYHASKDQLASLKPQQAQKGSAEVPNDELLNAVYLTPDYGYALAMGSRPEGSTIIDEQNHTITFDRPELFNPEEEIYIYSIDSENVPENKLKMVDDLQYAIIDTEEIIPSEVKNTKAREVLDFYELTNWKEDKEISNEIKNLFGKLV